MAFGIGMNFGPVSSGDFPEPNSVKYGVVYGPGLVGTAIIGDLDPPPPGLCIVRFVVRDLALPVPGATVEAQIYSSNPTVNTAVMARVKHQATTDAEGIADLVLVQKSQFTRSDGVYLIRVKFPTGKLLHNRLVTVPDSASEFPEDLPDAAGVRF